MARNVDDGLADIGRAGRDHSASNSDLVDPDPLGCGSELVRDAGNLVGLEVEARPDVEHDAIPVQPFPRLSLGLRAANRGERLEQHPLEVRQLDGAPRRIAHDRHGPNLGHGKESLVLRILLCDAVIHVDVLW